MSDETTTIGTSAPSPVAINPTAERGSSQPINVAVNGGRQERGRDYIVASFIVLAMVCLGGIGISALFYVPQDGNLVLSVKNDLKEIILMLLSGYFTAKVVGTK